MASRAPLRLSAQRKPRRGGVAPTPATGTFAAILAAMTMAASGAATGGATAITLSGPTTGTSGSAATFTVTANGALSSVVVTPNATGLAGTFSPTSITLTASSLSGTFTFTPAATGTASISITNNGGLANLGSPISLAVGAASAFSTTFTLTSTSTQAAAPFTVGHAFRKADVPAGSSVAVSGASAQVIAKRTWNDGSLKHAVISGAASLTANVPKTITLAIGTPSGTALTRSALEASVSTANQNKVQCGSFGTVDLASVLASGFVRTWISGPEMIECHYRGDVGGGTLLSVWFHVRLYAGGRVWVRAIVENGYIDNGAGAVAANANRAYVPTVTIGGSVAYSNGGVSLTHYANTRWLTDGWIGGDPQVTPRHDVAYLRNAKLFENYAWTSPAAATLDALAQTYIPMGIGNLPVGMGTVGDAPHIGTLPKWNALYATTGDARAFRATVANSLHMNSYGIIWRDFTTKLIPKPSQFTDWSVFGPATAGTDTLTTAYTWDTDHNPCESYAAYLLTGDYAHYETMMFNVSAMYFALSWYYTDAAHLFFRGYGLNRMIVMQIRGAGWSLRTMSVLAAIAPDEELAAGQVMAEYRTLLSNNVDFWKAKVDIPINGLGYLYTYTSSGYIGHGDPGSGFTPHWMHNFWSAGVGFAFNLEPLPNMTNYGAVLSNLYKGIVGLLGDNRNGGFHYTYAALYNVKVAPVNTLSDADNYYDDWGTVFTQTVGAGSAYYASYGAPVISDTLQNDGVAEVSPSLDGSGLPSGAQVNRWGELLPSIAHAVDHGALGAAQAFTRLVSATNWSDVANSGFDDQPHWGVMPREPLWRQGQAVNEWREIAGSSMSLTPPTVNPGPNPADRINAWCGLSIDTRSNTVWAPGNGGHANYFGNEVMRFDLGADAPKWVEVLPSSPLSAVNTLAAPNDNARYSDGRPASVHGYTANQFIERHNRAVRVGALATSQQGGAFWDVDGWNVNAAAGTNGWDAQYTYAPIYPADVNGRAGASSQPGDTFSPGWTVCKDPDTETIYCFTGRGDFPCKKMVPSSSGVGGTWTAIGGAMPASFTAQLAAVAFDTRRKRILIAKGAAGGGAYPYSGDTRYVTFDVTAGIYTEQTLSGAALAGLNAVATCPGMVYVPALDSYLIRPGSSAGSTVYVINAGTFVVTTLTTTGGGSIPSTLDVGAASYENVFSKWLFVPSLRGVMYYPQYTSNVWFLRLY